MSTKNAQKSQPVSRAAGASQKASAKPKPKPKPKPSKPRQNNGSDQGNSLVRKYVSMLVDPWANPGLKAPRLNPVITTSGASWQNLSALVPNNTDQVQYYMGTSQYKYAASYGSGSLPASNVTHDGYITGTCFPAEGQVASCAIKSLGFKLQTTATYSNAYGYVAIGSMKPGQSGVGTSWNNFINQPDVRVYPMISLVGKTVHAYGRKYSSIADNFIGPTTDVDDFALPLCLIYTPGTAKTADQIAGGTLIFDTMSTYDCVMNPANMNPLTTIPDLSSPSEVSALNAAGAAISQSQSNSFIDTVSTAIGGYAPAAAVMAGTTGFAAVGMRALQVLNNRAQAGNRGV